jgi:hypothetical protein
MKFERDQVKQSILLDSHMCHLIMTLESCSTHVRVEHGT